MARAVGRRQFLRLSAWAAAPLAFPLSQTRALPPGDPDVVVIGAGLSGLRAAQVLLDAGKKVVILEARANPGGRVQTIREPFDDGLYGEAGPIRILGIHRLVLSAARQAGIPLVPFAPTSGTSLITVRGTTMASTDPLGRGQAALDLKPDERGLTLEALQRRYIGTLPADLADAEPTAASYVRWAPYDKVTWPEWLQSRGASPGAVTLLTLGGDSRQLSALYMLRQIARLGTSRTSYKLHGGMDTLPRAMAQSMSGVIRYNAAVVRLNRDAQQVRVDYMERTASKSIVASRVVLAIPFSTLRNIEVRPPFSREKERVIEDLAYFPSTRFVLQSRTRFWKRAGLTGSARTDQPAEIWDAAHEVPVDRGILGATAGGAIGRSLMDVTPADGLAFGVSLVEQTFPQIRANFEKGAVRQWALEPWSRGAFAVFGPGQMTSMRPAIASPEGRVHFAGEHTSTWTGWMEGALQSGERAAREVISMDTAR